MFFFVVHIDNTFPDYCADDDNNLVGLHVEQVQQHQILLCQPESRILKKNSKYAQTKKHKCIIYPAGKIQSRKYLSSVIRYWKYFLLRWKVNAIDHQYITYPNTKKSPSAQIRAPSGENVFTNFSSIWVIFWIDSIDSIDFRH